MCIQKRAWSPFGGLLPVWSTTSFSIWRNHRIWEVHSANKGDALKPAVPEAGTGRQKGPTSSPQQHPITQHTTNASKAQPIELWSFALSTIFTWPLTNRLPLLQASRQLFAGKSLPQPAGGRKCFPRVHWILSTDFHATEINILILVGQNVLTVMVPILINKNVFKPSYNDLKFTVSYCNYICTNLNSSTGFPGGWVVKNLPVRAGEAGDRVRSLGREDPLEKEMATHSSTLAWRIT